MMMRTLPALALRSLHAPSVTTPALLPASIASLRGGEGGGPVMSASTAIASVLG